jgi:hypothetical protein
MTRLTVLPLVLALVLATGGCGQLPRPFQPGAKDVDLKALLARKTLYVPAPPWQHGEEFAVALVAALEARDLPAVLTGSPANRRVELAALATPAVDGETVILRATVIEPDGRALLEQIQTVRMPIGDWATGDTLMLAALADRLAGDLAAALAPAPIAQALPGFPDARLVVLPVSGAPGDGADSLPSALRAELSERNLPLAREAAPNDLLVAGTVTVLPVGAGRERATVTWRLLAAGADGRSEAEIGEVSQSNVIPAGQLDGRWGEIAALVADSAADGLEDLLDRAADRR